LSKVMQGTFMRGEGSGTQVSIALSRSEDSSCSILLRDTTPYTIIRS